MKFDFPNGYTRKQWLDAEKFNTSNFHPATNNIQPAL
jgi:hypothetical protein